MRRREFIALLGSAAVWPVVARAAESRVRRVGILLSAAATETEYQGYLAGFVQEMQQRGWTEGKNLQMDVCWNAGDATLSRRMRRNWSG
jgi:putative tryptophan/tyrosine transport system substrate-binding protein